MLDVKWRLDWLNKAWNDEIKAEPGSAMKVPAGTKDFDPSAHTHLAREQKLLSKSRW